MSDFNSPRSGQSNVVGIDDVAVARSVIKALRSSANSTRNYKQNATRDDHIISDIGQFNKMVIDKSEIVSKQNAKEQQINEALSNYIPPTLPMPILNSPTEQKFREETKDRFEEDSDSDEDEYARGKRRPHGAETSSHPRAGTDSMRSSREFMGASKMLAPPKADLDFDSDGDDPSEMAELMADFVAPNSSTRGGLSKAQVYKGQSSNTSTSIKYGAGGIRGIQHQSLQREREGDIDTMSVSSVQSHSSVTSTATASKLMHIKPGQAIRVKAPNKKSRSVLSDSSFTG